MTEKDTVIAYPINSPEKKNDLNDSYLSYGESNYEDNTIDMSGNFFNQLDSMIAAVKMESNALDSMKEKLKEVDGLRDQISAFTKRLIDADQANLNLKSNLVKAQEAYAEIKKAKAEVESSMVPLRQELNRFKDMYNKERTTRLAVQQENSKLKEHLSRLERTNEELNRECKSIPALTESNELLKNDLSQLRKKYKEEKSSLQKQIKQLQSQSRDVENIKGVVRSLSLKLLDISSNGPTSSGAATNINNANGSNYGYQNAQFNAENANFKSQSNYANRNSSNIHYDYNYNVNNDYDSEYLDEDEEEDSNEISNGSEYENDGQSYIEESSQVSIAMGSSVGSINSGKGGFHAPNHQSPPRRNVNQNIQLVPQNNVKHKKKKTRKIQGKQSQTTHVMQSEYGNESGMLQSLSLPKISH